MKKLLIGGLALFLFAGCAQIFPPAEPDVEEKEKTVVTASADYTEDQKKVVDNFGEPDEFTMRYHFEEEPRLETWRYVEVGQVFMFTDGEFNSSYEVEFGLPENQVYTKAKINPKDVYAIADLKSLEKLLGVEATGSVDVNEEVWEDATFYDFAGVVSAATIDDDLVFVKTQSQVAPYTWDELAAKLDDGIEGGKDTTKPEGAPLETLDSDLVVYDEGYGVKVKMPARWAEYDVSEEFDDDDEVARISFLMPTSDTEYAADGYVNMFMVAAYFQGTTDDISFDETVIGENEDFLYTFSHMNGIPPADLEGHLRDFDDIRDNIEIYELPLEFFL